MSANITYNVCRRIRAYINFEGGNFNVKTIIRQSSSKNGRE
mgnify:CR=1 FL=1